MAATARPARARTATLVVLALLLVIGGVSGTAPGTPVAAAATPMFHTVVPGDTPSSIGRRYGIAWTSIATWNGLTQPYTVHPDALLRLRAPVKPPPAFRSSVGPVTAASLGASYRSGCPVGPASLRRVHVTFWSFSGTAGRGELVVHASVVPQTVAAFQRLYTQRVPIRRMVPVSVYGGSDARSMDADNTSAFNCRRTVSGTSWSEHSYGRAIDINPVENPYVKGRTVLPAAGVAFTDRTRYRRGMLHDPGAVRAFTDNGFVWGGAWRTLKDYQHVSTTGR